MSGTEVALLALAAGGTAMQHKAQKDANKERRSQLAMLNQENAQKEQQALGILAKNAEEYQPEKRAQRLQEAEQTAQTSLGEYLTKAQQASPETAQGKLSTDYLASKGSSKAAELERALTLTSLMAKMRAPSDLRTQEGFANAEYASQLGNIGGQQQRNLAARQQDISGVEPNQNQLIFGDLAKTMGLYGAVGGMRRRGMEMPRQSSMLSTSYTGGV